MPIIDPAELAPVDRYRLLIASIVPRPIAWVTSVDRAGGGNLAPFSFFNGVTSSPPTVAIAIGHQNPPKDTLVNLRARGEAVVHLVPAGYLDQAHASGGEYRPDIDEASLLGLATRGAEVVSVPILEAADIALECTLAQELAVGEPAASLCLLTVVRAHVAEAVAGDDGLPDPERLRAVARLGGRCYLSADGWQVVARKRQAVPDGQRR